MMVDIISDEGGARAFVGARADIDAVARLERYCVLLLEENQAQNLISKATVAQLWQRHIADSAQLIDHVPRETWDQPGIGPWLDLGSGPGLPGLVIAALRPEFPVVLVESRARRIEFLERCVRELALDHCRVVGQRLETVHPFGASVISARAFAPIEKLLRLSAPFSTKSTRYVLPKGRSAAQELSRLKPSIRKMFHVKPSQTDPEAGIIVSV